MWRMVPHNIGAEGKWRRPGGGGGGGLFIGFGGNINNPDDQTDPLSHSSWIIILIKFCRDFWTVVEPEHSAVKCEKPLINKSILFLKIGGTEVIDVLTALHDHQYHPSTLSSPSPIGDHWSRRDEGWTGGLGWFHRLLLCQLSAALKEKGLASYGSQRFWSTEAAAAAAAAALQLKWRQCRFKCLCYLQTSKFVSWIC